ncbi:MAG: MoxR family ATPase [Lachnospiraceae bacterium]|nr:MoxR family ATPase [Lachnospiraceae bacterium]MCR5129046.1 MoxR family ATPase [Lachnospiraceae bacterium]
MNEYDVMQQKLLACEFEIGREIIGQRNVIRSVMLAILSGGNVLLEGMPGLGKTRLVNTISHVLNLSFKRIQFTPDLMPGDITGTNIMERSESGSAFRFEAGPIFANIILADEINRATPKTQSALLEAMQEHIVTVGNVSHKVPEPFFVLATQNPIETEGTYPLPEAQLDRFMFKIMVPFPTKEELAGIVGLTESVQQGAAQTVLNGDELQQAIQMAKEIKIADAVMDYILDIMMATHGGNKYVREGASPRAAQAIIRGAKARAFMEGRYNVSFEDVDTVVPAVLRHRLILSFDAVSDGVNEDMVVADIVKNVKAQMVAQNHV